MHLQSPTPAPAHALAFAALQPHLHAPLPLQPNTRTCARPCLCCDRAIFWTCFSLAAPRPCRSSPAGRSPPLPPSCKPLWSPWLLLPLQPSWLLLRPSKLSWPLLLLSLSWPTRSSQWIWSPLATQPCGDSTPKGSPKSRGGA